MKTKQKNNCLKYLLNHKDLGKFKIVYNGDHCKGVYHNFKEIQLEVKSVADGLEWLPIEEVHSLKTLTNIFELNKKESRLLNVVFNFLNK